MVAITFMKMYSSRVPNKNMRMMNGKPLFYWVLTTLLHAKNISEIYIDTDSPVIQSAVKQYFGNDINILERIEEVRGNDVTANTLINSMLGRISGDHFLQTHVTNPLLKLKTVENAIAEYYNSKTFGYDSLLGVTEHRGNFYNVFGEPINHNPRHIVMTQDRECLYEDNSTMYIFSRKTFRDYGRVGKSPKFYLIDKTEAVDIDTEDDFKLAEAVMLYQDRRCS